MQTYILDEMRCMEWVDEFYNERYSSFRLKKKPKLPEISIVYDDKTTIRGGATQIEEGWEIKNFLVITKNPPEIMEYICYHEGSHILHRISNPITSFWDEESNKDEKKELVKEVVADTSTLTYLNGRSNFKRFLEIAEENKNGTYIDYVRKELKRGEKRLRNLIKMHPDKAYKSIVGVK